MWGEWRYSATFLDLGTRWRWIVSFTPRPLYPGTHWIRGWASPRPGLDAVESNPGRPSPSPLLCQLMYLESIPLVLQITLTCANRPAHYSECYITARESFLLGRGGGGGYDAVSICNIKRRMGMLHLLWRCGRVTVCDEHGDVIRNWVYFVFNRVSVFIRETASVV
jgi:hypothetical protein